MLGEAPSLELAEDLLTVEVDLERPAPGADELGVDARLGPDDVRQTGGSGEIVSLHAVGDGQLATHGLSSVHGAVTTHVQSVV